MALNPKDYFEMGLRKSQGMQDSMDDSQRMRPHLLLNKRAEDLQTERLANQTQIQQMKSDSASQIGQSKIDAVTELQKQRALDSQKLQDDRLKQQQQMNDDRIKADKARQQAGLDANDPIKTAKTLESMRKDPQFKKAAQQAAMDRVTKANKGKAPMTIFGMGGPSATLQDELAVLQQMQPLGGGIGGGGVNAGADDAAKADAQVQSILAQLQPAMRNQLIAEASQNGVDTPQEWLKFLNSKGF